MKPSTATYLADLLADHHQRLLTKLEELMSQQTDALKAEIAALSNAISAVVADRAAKNDEIRSLTAKLEAAQAAVGDPADAVAIDEALTALKSLSASLA